MTPDLPKCPACPHYLAIHGPRGCVAASGCVCRRTVKHGTSGAYGYWGCRCDDCRAYKRAANQRYHRGEVAYRLPRRVADPDDIDPVAVERACDGEAVVLNRAELDAAFRILDDRGYSAKEIGRRLGVCARTAERWRAGIRGADHQEAAA